MKVVVAWVSALLGIVGIGVGVEAGAGVGSGVTALALLHEAGCQQAVSDYEGRLHLSLELCAELTPPYADLTAITTPSTMPPTLTSWCRVFFPPTVPLNLYLPLVVGPDWAIIVGGRMTAVQRRSVATSISMLLSGTVLIGDC
jgi:hypothetical protein